MPDDVVLATRIPQTGEEHTVFPVLFILVFFLLTKEHSTTFLLQPVPLDHFWLV